MIAPSNTFGRKGSGQAHYRGTANDGKTKLRPI